MIDTFRRYEMSFNFIWSNPKEKLCKQAIGFNLNIL